MNFNIEKGLSPNKVKSTKGSLFSALPLAQMLDGDSIFIPKEFSNPSSISSFISLYNKKETESFFTIRKVEGGCRVFKLERK